jgi:hypothetical protein
MTCIDKYYNKRCSLFFFVDNKREANAWQGKLTTIHLVFRLLRELAYRYLQHAGTRFIDLSITGTQRDLCVIDATALGADWKSLCVHSTSRTSGTFLTQWRLVWCTGSMDNCPYQNCCHLFFKKFNVPSTVLQRIIVTIWHLLTCCGTDVTYRTDMYNKGGHILLLRHLSLHIISHITRVWMRERDTFPSKVYLSTNSRFRQIIFWPIPNSTNWYFDWYPFPPKRFLTKNSLVKRI